MTEPLPFQPKGVMSMRAACLTVFRGMAPGEWIDDTELWAKVCELTQADCEQQSVQSAAWAAREELAAEREGGVEWHMGGYKRLDTAGKVAAVDSRIRRVRRGLSRLAHRAGDALADPELPMEQRQRMQTVERSAVMQSEIDLRRAARRRPLPPGEQ